MSGETFSVDEPREAPGNGQLILDLEGYEGPLDVLLDLARHQKVDLSRISILALADQYLAFIARAPRLELEFAADYLVMAAWLAYLKSRLLLPRSGDDDEPSGPAMAAALAFQLQRLEAMREAGARLMARPRLGREVFARGAPEAMPVITRPVFELSLFELLDTYARQESRRGDQTLRIAATALHTVEDAIRRLGALLGDMPRWQTLSSFLPAGLEDDMGIRSAIASTLAASLELVRTGKVDLRQDTAFGPIYVRGRRGKKT